MNSVHKFVFAIVLFNPVQSDVCDFDDTKCLLAGANRYYDRIVSGIDGIAKPSDPLCYDKVKGQVKCLKYCFTNITMTGMRNCEIIDAVIQNTSQPGILLYRFDLFCPKLVLKYNYKAEGHLGPVYIDGTGLATITLIDYVIIFTGIYKEFISDEDGKPHFTIKYNPIDTDPRGKLTLEAESENKKIAKQAAEYINSHWDEFEKYLQCPTIIKLMAKFNARQYKYIRTLAVDELFPKKYVKNKKLI